MPARDHFARPGHAHGPEGLTNLMAKAEMELRRTTAQRRATTYMFVASIAAAVSRSPRASRLMSPPVADDRRKESPAKAGLSLQEEPSNVTFTIDEQQTSPAASLAM